MSIQNIPRVIGVDLTPILPGGENGGAKIFVFELIRELGKVAPETRFILLTSAQSHDELATLDAPNISRRMVLSGRQGNGTLKRIMQGVLRRLPGRLRGFNARMGYLIYLQLKRLQAQRKAANAEFDLLFCPFTAPTFSDPHIPTVCTIYDLQYKTFPAFFSSQDVMHRDMTFRNACQKATLLTAISNYSRMSAIEHGNIAPDRIRTIYLQMAQRVKSPAKMPFKALGLETKRYLLYPANFWKHKNHEMAITAFGMARARGLDPDLKLVFTGAPGERRDYLMDCVTRAGLSDYIVFAGFLDDAQFGDLLAKSLGLFFPSLYEGFGLPIIEAMAAGVPVACSRVASLPEVAGGAALTFNPRIPEEICAALLALANNQDTRSALIASGYDQIRQFNSSTKMAHEYWDLFCEAMGRSNQISGLLGHYEDGWCSGRLKLLVDRHDSPRVAEFVVDYPDWSPAMKIEIVDVSAKAPLFVAELKRGKKHVWKATVPAGASTVSFELRTPFVPAYCGLGHDTRELTLILERCDIIGSLGERETIFPARSSGADT